MTRRKLQAWCIGASALASLSGQALAINLTGIGYTTFGDANSYSMPFANFQATGDSTPQPGDPYYIASSPGQISMLAVIGTGASGQPVNTNFAGMDDAYPTPSGVSGSNFFSTGTIADPVPATPFAGDDPDTWDATLEALSTFLQGNQMVFFFNNNQLNSLGTYGQSLGVWAQAWISDTAGNVIDPDGAGPQTGYYELTNQMKPFQLQTEGGGGTYLGDPTAFTSSGRTNPGGNANGTDYVLSGGQLCAATSLGGAPVSCSSPLADIGPVNHNLGANNATYAVVVPELNALMDSLISSAAGTLSNYVLHLDVRMGCDPTLFGTDPTAAICDGDGVTWNKNLNNGYEQIFIGQLERPGVAEPGALALLGMACLAAFAGKRRAPKEVLALA
ncbi:MAG: hypothetical protein GC151_06780 [Betaproteobacteria bacterium]|nr:hypothetical protein [Betaproteobacteria bacterium]